MRIALYSVCHQITFPHLHLICLCRYKWVSLDIISLDYVTTPFAFADARVLLDIISLDYLAVMRTVQAVAVQSRRTLLTIIKYNSLRLFYLMLVKHSHLSCKMYSLAITKSNPDTLLFKSYCKMSYAQLRN